MDRWVRLVLNVPTAGATTDVVVLSDEASEPLQYHSSAQAPLWPRKGNMSLQDLHAAVQGI
jgi:hypothetical protein